MAEACVGEDGRVATRDLTPRHRLATYGTLGPGRAKHHEVAALEGRWIRGSVCGRLVDAGWGAAYGFPALVLDPNGEEVAVDVLESADLPGHWPRLDELEGSSYRRVTTAVATGEGALEACIYVLAG